MPSKQRTALDECWCCGRPGLHQARRLCVRCYSRWQGRGFTGPGPGPEWAPQAERAREHARTITQLPARQAAERLGVSPRTVQRYRAALRNAA